MRLAGHAVAVANMIPFSTARQKRRKDQLIRVTVTRSILVATPIRTAQPHPVINVRETADDDLEEPADGGVQPRHCF